MQPIYLDHAATTPLDPAVLDAMSPYFTEHYGNASSVHRLGRKARHVVEDCRNRIARLLSAEPGEIIFTSGGTEANNLAIHSAVAASDASLPLITSAAEHESVLRPAEKLKEEGYPVQILRPDRDGAVSAEYLEEVLRSACGAALVSLMYVNNEVGTLTDVERTASICREWNAPSHVDSVQAAGLYELEVDQLGADMLSLSAHKFYGPKGIGMLYVRGGGDTDPLLLGGSQERGRRAGTENVPAIVGMTRALELATADSKRERERLRALRERLAGKLRDGLAVPYEIAGASEPVRQAPHILNVVFPDDRVRIDGEMLLLNMDMEGICVSSGSACTSGALSPSHVLSAMGYSDGTASAAVRFSMGKATDEEAIDAAAEALARVTERMARVPA